jgi:hypothetical protein
VSIAGAGEAAVSAPVVASLVDATAAIAKLLRFTATVVDLVWPHASTNDTSSPALVSPRFLRHARAALAAAAAAHLASAVRAYAVIIAAVCLFLNVCMFLPS